MVGGTHYFKFGFILTFYEYLKLKPSSAQQSIQNFTFMCKL